MRCNGMRMLMYTLRFRVHIQVKSHIKTDVKKIRNKNNIPPPFPQEKTPVAKLFPAYMSLDFRM